jgi:drug/metabolite transporter (DMT)-like permease
MAISYVYLALLSAFLGGVMDIFARHIVQGITPKHMLIWSLFSISLFLGIFSPFYFSFTYDLRLLTIFLSMCFLDFLANLCYFKSLKNANASTVTPILSLAPAFTFAVSWAFATDKIEPDKLIYTFGIILLVIFFTIDKKNLKLQSKNVLIPALGSAVLFGSSAVFAKQILSSGLTNPPSLYFLRAVTMGLTAFLFFGKGFLKIGKKNIISIFIRSTVVIARWVIMYYALSMGNAGVTLTLVNTSPIFVFVLSTLILKEKIELKKAITAILVFILAFNLK